MMSSNRVIRYVFFMPLALSFCDSRVCAELVAYWNFDGNVVDQSGNGNDGELFDARYSDNVPAVIGSGQSVGFEEDTDHVFVAADDSLDSEEFTLAMFVYDRGQVGALERLTSREGDTFETALNVHPPFQGTGEIAYYSGAGGGWQWASEEFGADDFVTLEEETWQHVAYVANAEDETMSIYLDGQRILESIDPWIVMPSGFMHIGNRWNDLEGFDGLLDDLALWDEVLTDEQIQAMAAGGVAALLNPSPTAPLNDGSLTDPVERAAYVQNTLGTWMGDSNLDLEFNSSDLVAVFSAGKYETVDAATWEQGDWNGDQVFNSSDLVTAFSDGGYEMGPRPAAAAVPEPMSFGLCLLGALVIGARRQRRMEEN